MGVNTLGRLGFLILQLHALISVFTPAGDVIQQSQLIYNQTEKPRAREKLINRWTQVRLEAAEQPTNISTIKSHAANCKLLHQRLCWCSRRVPRRRSTMKQHSSCIWPKREKHAKWRPTLSFSILAFRLFCTSRLPSFLAYQIEANITTDVVLSAVTSSPNCL